MRYQIVLLFCVSLIGCRDTHEDSPLEAIDPHADHAQNDEAAGHEEHEEHEDPEEHAEHGEHPGGEEHDEHDEHDEHEGEENVVHLTEAAAERLGLQLGVAEAGNLATQIEVPAEIHLNPDTVAHISPLVAGQLLRVDVTIGDVVVAGQPLAELRSVELGQARAELTRTTSMRELAAQTRERQRRLREEGINSDRSLLEAEIAYDQADAERDAALSRLQVFGVRGGSGPDMVLESPITGVVLERHATQGENVAAGETLFVVADLSRVWLVGRAYEQQVGAIVADMDASFTLNAYPGQQWTGELTHIGSALDEATRTLTVRVDLENPDGLFRPGLYGSLRLSPADVGAESVVIPNDALQQLNDDVVVFVPGDESGEYRAVPVRAGRSDGTRVEIVEGLSAGDSLVVGGAFVLKSEMIRGQLGHGHAH